MTTKSSAANKENLYDNLAYEYIRCMSDMDGRGPGMYIYASYFLYGIYVRRSRAASVWHASPPCRWGCAVGEENMSQAAFTPDRPFAFYNHYIFQ